VHGIPGRRRLRRGDLVKLDVTAELDGFYADACRTVVVGEGRPQALKLVRTAEQALQRALRVAVAGRPLNAIGASVQETVHARGFSLCDGLMGHGIGRRIHEAPDVPNTFEPALSQPLGEGLVITVEPLVAAGGPGVRLARDGWTLRTADASWSAHAEHTIVVRDGAPLVLTA
jgi:methionyl aminopeptidase